MTTEMRPFWAIEPLFEQTVYNPKHPKKPDTKYFDNHQRYDAISTLLRKNHLSFIFKQLTVMPHKKSPYCQ